MFSSGRSGYAEILDRYPRLRSWGKMFRISASLLNVAVGVCVSMALLSTGAAAADPAADPNQDVIGMKYAAAKGVLGQANLTAVVATVVGDRLPQDECRVVSTSKPTFLDQSGDSKGNLIQVNLNCFLSASVTDPGFSAGNTMSSAQAVRDADVEETLEWKQTAGGQKWCQQAAIEHPEWVPISGCPDWEQTADGQEWCQEAQIEHPEWCRSQDARSTSAPIHIYVDGAA